MYRLSGKPAQKPDWTQRMAIENVSLRRCSPRWKASIGVVRMGSAAVPTKATRPTPRARSGRRSARRSAATPPAARIGDEDRDPVVERLGKLEPQRVAEQAAPLLRDELGERGDAEAGAEGGPQHRRAARRSPEGDRRRTAATTESSITLSSGEAPAMAARMSGPATDDADERAADRDRAPGEHEPVAHGRGAAFSATPSAIPAARATSRAIGGSGIPSIVAACGTAMTAAVAERGDPEAGGTGRRRPGSRSRR